MEGKMSRSSHLGENTLWTLPSQIYQALHSWASKGRRRKAHLRRQVLPHYHQQQLQPSILGLLRVQSHRMRKERVRASPDRQMIRPMMKTQPILNSHMHIIPQQNLPQQTLAHKVRNRNKSKTTLISSRQVGVSRRLWRSRTLSKVLTLRILSQGTGSSKPNPWMISHKNQMFSKILYHGMLQWWRQSQPN